MPAPRLHAHPLLCSILEFAPVPPASIPTPGLPTTLYSTTIMAAVNAWQLVLYSLLFYDSCCFKAGWLDTNYMANFFEETGGLMPSADTDGTLSMCYLLCKAQALWWVSKTDAISIVMDCIHEMVTQWTLNYNSDKRQEGQVENAQRVFEQSNWDLGFQEEGCFKWSLKDDGRPESVKVGRWRWGRGASLADRGRCEHLGRVKGAWDPRMNWKEPLVWLSNLYCFLSLDLWV